MTASRPPTWRSGCTIRSKYLAQDINAEIVGCLQLPGKIDRRCRKLRDVQVSRAGFELADEANGRGPVHAPVVRLNGSAARRIGLCTIRWR